MPEGIWGAKGIPRVSAFTHSIQAQWRALPLPSRIPTTINLAPIWEEDQLPVYYTRWALRGAKKRYPLMEKVAFSLVTAACKLRPYFQEHIIVVQMDKPLRKTMNNLKTAEWLVLWAIKWSEIDVQYHPRAAIKV